MNRPILLTNDDGYDAPGLRALWNCAVGLGLGTVRVAAPARPWSVKSHATTVDPLHAISVRPIELDGMEGIVVDGSPADCPRVALRGVQMLNGDIPLVLSGINQGANLGIDAYYSGTLAAAREAVALGCSGIGLSVLTHKQKPVDWDRITEWATTLLAWLIPQAVQKGPSLWSINFPNSSSDKTTMPDVVVAPMCTHPLKVAYVPHAETDGSLSYSGSYYERPTDPGSDVQAVFEGFITVTPMVLDLTDWAGLESVRENLHSIAPRR